MNEHICDKLAQGNPKPLFNFINNKRGQNNTIKNIDGTSDDQGIAESFVEAFTSVFTVDDNLLPTPVSPKHLQTDQIQIDENGVFSLLNKLDPTKSTGPDNLSPALLKFLAPYIYKTVAKIYQYSITTSTVPSDWRQANVIPVHKKNSKSDPLNYRPISLTSILCKNLEHIIAHNIHAYLDKHHILYEHQHGFRNKHGCDTQLLNTITDFVNSYDSLSTLDLIILDFSKAFDVVSHPKLLFKIAQLGIHPNTRNWIKSWLENRSHRVTVNGVTSSSKLVTSGVPQGSVLGPLLFLIYINDMPDSFYHSTLKLFADDSLLYHNIENHSDQSNLQTDLNNLILWSQKWQMHFNASKCETMRITRSTSNITCPSYCINNTQLDSVDSVKYLGVNIDHKLNFKNHIIKICKKANDTLHMLKRSLKRAQTLTRITAYKSLCRPILEYATIVWSPHTDKLIKLIEAINRKAFRWCYKIPKYDRISATMSLENWQTLKFRRESADIRMYSRIMSGKASVDPQRFTLNQCVHDTRMGGIRDTVNTDVKRFSYQHRIHKILNRI